MSLSIWEILRRCNEGEKMDEKVFDMSIFKKTEELRKDTGLTYNPESPILMDDHLIDNVFEAGIKFYADIGTLCMDTKRVVRFTENEIREALRVKYDDFFLGEGKDRVKVYKRTVEDKREPIVAAGLQTLIYSDEETMFKILTECAKDRCVDGIWGGVVLKIEGEGDVKAKTPSEIYGFKKNAEIMRKAIDTAGRPGMFIINNAPTCIGSIAMRDSEKGLRHTDPTLSLGISEMKISFDDLNRAARAWADGDPIHGNHTTIIGGFSGTMEGNAIVSVAGSLQSLMLNRANMIRPEIHEPIIQSAVTRKELWIGSVVFQAIARNANFILNGGMGDHPEAGPGTKGFFYEAAAGHIVSTVCGGHSMGGTRKFFIGNKENFGTPLESRWMGEACKGAAGLSREKANEIILRLLDKYEHYLRSAPTGETFEALYDTEKVKPLAHYQKLYDEVKEEFSALGLTFNY